VAVTQRGADAFLGVDVGTQGVRAVLVDGGGAVLATGSSPLDGGADRRAGHRHEQDPAAWWRALCAATGPAVAALGGRRLGALAIDSTSGTILVQDRAGTARGPALMYDDGRAAAEAVRAQAAGAELWGRLGYRIQPSWALPKAVWLAADRPLRAGDRIVHQADHLAARLVGHPVATDTSHALKTGVDPVAVAWPAGVLAALGLDAALLPEVVLPGTVLGAVSARAAEETGIPAGTPVRAGMTDGCAAQIASRALAPGAWSSALGTTLVVKGATSTPLHDPTGTVYSHRNPDGGWLPGGASSTGAGIIRQDFPGADLAGLTREAASWEPAPGITYPLAGKGERFPFRAPEAQGFSTLDGDEGARFAGVLQGIAFIERLCFESLASLGADTSGPVTLTGGATANAYWNQLRADVLGRTVLVPESAEAALGMAVLAAAPPGGLAGTAERMVRIRNTYRPDPDRGARFSGAYHDLLAALRERGWLTDPSELTDPTDPKDTDA
jgi:sugar (pentulose or hexulose) kinase